MLKRGRGLYEKRQKKAELKTKRDRPFKVFLIAEARTVKEISLLSTMLFFLYKD